MQWRGEQWLQKEIAKADKEMQKPQVAGPEKAHTTAAIQTGPTFASQGAMSSSMQMMTASTLSSPCAIR
jgi:hypothetical protein